MRSVQTLAKRLLSITRYSTIVLIAFFVSSLAVYTYTRVSGQSSTVYAATSSTLNFQGRLYDSAGKTVPDGNYNIQFKLYDGGTAGGPAGTGQANAGSLLWTETRDYNGGSPDNRIKVTNGYFVVNLGSVNSFGTNIKWDQELWLTMNIGGSGTSPTWDGEMLSPGNTRTKLTAVPYAFQAATARKLMDEQLSGIGTLQFNTLTNNRTITLPDASGEVLLDSTGFANGGNNFGAAAVLGTNDVNDLILRTAGNEGLRLDQSGNVGIGTNADAVEKLEVNGGIKIGNTANANAGTIRWTGSDFEGYDGSQWKSLTLGSMESATASFTAGLANVGANVTGAAVETLIFTSATAVSNTAGVTGFTAPADGSFTTCLVKNNANVTSGTLNLRWRVNGVSVGAGACTMNTSKPRESATALAGGTVTFQAGDTIGVAFDTVGLAPTTNDFTVYWTVKYTTGGNMGPSFTQGGNSFGGTAILGTNDNQALRFITNGNQALNITTSGQADFSAGVSVANGLQVVAGGINNNSGGITATGALNGVTTLSASGAISGATAGNTINGLVVNSGSLSSISGFTQASGNFSYSNASGSFSINSSAFDVSSSGDLTGVNSLTGVAALTVASGGSSALTLDSASNILNIAASDTGIQRSAAGTYTIDLNSASATTLSINNGGAGVAGLSVEGGGSFGGNTTISGTLTGLAGLTVNSGGINVNNSGITAVGSIAGLTTVNASGLITGTGGLTISGAAVSLNASSNFNTDINTGTSNGTVSIGGGNAVFQLNSTAFDVSSAGALSGITTISASGAITGATATNTINGLVVNSGSLSSITGYAQSSGNFSQTGTGTFGTGTGAVSLNGSTNISTNTNGAVALNVNGTTGTAATALNIAQTGNAANLTLSNTALTTGALMSITQSTSAFTGTGLLLNFASGSGSFASGNFIDFQLNGTSRFKVDNTGALQITSGSAAGLNVQSTGGLSYFSVDVASAAVRVGSSTADAVGVLLVLDTKNTTGDPAGINGGSYYNSVNGKARCFENGQWTDCQTEVILGETTLGAANATISVSLNQTYEALTCKVAVKSRSAASFPYLRFNNVSTGNLYSYNLYGITAAAVVDAQNTSQNQIQMTQATSNVPFSATIDITNFPDVRKTADWSAAGADAITTQPNRFNGVGVYNLTSGSITSVQVVASTGTFAAGSHMYCVGRNVR